MDHPQFPKNLLTKMYDWLKANKIGDKKDDHTMDQFYYKLRKKAWGQFKKESWDIPKENQQVIRQALTKRFEFMFRQLNVVDTQDLVTKFVKPKVVDKNQNDFKLKSNSQKQVKGLAD